MTAARRSITVTVGGHDDTTSSGAIADSAPEPAGTDSSDSPADPLRPINTDRWSELARTVLIDEGVTGGHLDVIFVDRQPMADLNLEHLGHEGPTDVLAFPLDGPGVITVGMVDGPLGAVDGPGDGPALHLGDVVVCPQVAVEQAPSHAGTIEAELSLLVIHGVLHVLGHDHAEPDETEVMRARERHHLCRLGLTHPIPEPAADPVPC